MKFKCTFFMAAYALFTGVSCSSGGGTDDPEPTPTPPVIITVDELKIKSFEIAPDVNERIYGKIAFTADEQGVWHGAIEHYKADLSQLKAAFDAVAERVTVAGKEQQSGITANDFSAPVVYRLYATDGQYKEFTVRLENGTGTGLPIVAILTDGSVPITSKEKWLPGRIVFDPQESDYPALAVNMEAKGRGNNTWRLPKKPYAIKLAEKNPVLGMKKHKRWVLLANASDRTLMRNRASFEIGRRTALPWTPDSRFVEVILNGEYRGSYLLCEQIRIDANRVNIAEMKAEDTDGDAVTGGYLLEFDRYYDEINKFRTTYRDLPVNIKEPDEEVLGAQQRKYITEYVNHVEELLYAGSTIDKSYTDHIDIDSFIDWWIVVELTHNRDSRLPGSCYMYKDRGGKLCAGPLWDFDLQTFKASTSFLLTEYELSDFSSPHGDRSLWYKRLFSDPDFKARAKQRWQSYKASFDGIADFIDAEAAALQPSAAANWAMWTLDSGPNQDESLTWEEAVTKMRTSYLTRLQWMDGEIAKW